MKDGPECEEEDFCIQKETPIFDIEEVELDFSIKRICITTIHLCHACDTWFDGENLSLLFRILIYLSRKMRSWAYKAHISLNDIDNLRKFINRPTTNPLTKFCNARIIFFLEKWTVLSLVLELRFHFLCIVYHGAKFDH